MKTRSQSHWIVLLILLPVLEMWRQTLAGNCIGTEDGGHHLTPFLEFFRSNLQRGHIPLWNPYLLSGESFVGHPNSPVFYPLHYLVAMLPAHVYISWSVAGHMALGAVGMWRLALRWKMASLPAVFMGAAYGTSSLFYGEAERYMVAEILGWMPWLLVACEWAFEDIRHTWAGALIFGLQLSSGLHQYVHLECIVLLVLFLCLWGRTWGYSRCAIRLILIAGLGLVAAAADWMTLAAHLHDNVRSLALPSYFQVYPVTLDAVAKSLVPELYDSVNVDGTSQVYPLPLPVSFLAAAALLSWPRLTHLQRHLVLASSILVAAGMLLSLANGTSLEPALDYLIPLYAVIRYRYKYLVLTDLGLIWLAGVGLETLIGVRAKPGGMRLRLTCIGLVAATLIEMLWSGSHFNPAVSPTTLYSLPGFAKLPPPTSGFYRMVTLPWLPRKYWDWGMVPGIRNIEAFSTTSGIPYQEILEVGEFGKPMTRYSIQAALQRNMIRPQLRPEAPILRILGLKYALTYDPAQGVRVQTLPNPVPQAWVCPRWRSVGPIAELAILNNADFQPCKEALLRDSSKLPPPTDAVFTAGTCHVSEPDVDHLVVDVDWPGRAPGILVLTEIYDPDWKATLDDHPVELLVVDHALRGLVVPPGRHQIRMRYFPNALGFGLACTTAGLLAIGWLAWCSRPRHRDSRPAGDSAVTIEAAEPKSS